MKFVPLVLAFLLLAPAAQAGNLQLDSTDPTRTRVGALEFNGAVLIPPGKDKLGGLSSLWVDAKGEKIISLSDIGIVYEGQLKWDEKGWLQDVTFAPGYNLKNIDGGPFAKRADTEALARTPDGAWLVAFERDHRILRYPTLKGVPKAVPAPANLQRDLPRNLGLESLAVFPNGQMLTLAENIEANGTHRGWLWQEGHWLEFDYTGAPGFSPSDATFLNDGTALVLERRFSLFGGGFQAVISELDLNQIAAGKSVKGREIARLTSPLLTENFEGIFARTQPNGLTQLFLVSDNNLNGIQQTILAVFSISWVTH